MSRKFLVASAAALFGTVVLNVDASANTLGVSATVPDACTVAAGTLPFGTYDPATQTNDLQGSGTFDVTCTLLSDVDILMDAGANFSGSLRNLLSTTTADTLGYRLFQDVGLSLEWGDDGASHPSASQNFSALAAATTNITVHGTILGSQNVPGGTYQDTVNISLIFN